MPWFLSCVLATLCLFTIACSVEAPRPEPDTHDDVSVEDSDDETSDAELSDAEVEAHIAAFCETLDYESSNGASCDEAPMNTTCYYPDFGDNCDSCRFSDDPDCVPVEQGRFCTCDEYGDGTRRLFCGQECG